MELITPVRVVVVDDRPDHLFAIANALAVSGIPCVWHLYDSATNALTPPPPKDGYSDIRLIVSDLNIREIADAGREPKNLAGILLSDVLQPLLPRSPCPYGLVLWSSVQVKALEVAEFIGERICHPRVPPEDRRSAPLSVGLMDKAKFVTALPTSGAGVDMKTLLHEAAKSVADVQAQIMEALADPQLRLACAWETRVSEAAASAVNSVFTAAENHSTLGKLAPSEGLREVLAKLAQEAAGKKDAKDNPGRALDDGLVDLLVDNLRSTDDADKYQIAINKSIGELLSGAPVSLSAVARQQLNTDLHIESKVSPGLKRVARGVVLGAKDEKIVAAVLGYKKASAVIWPEFLIGVDEFRKAAEQAAADEHRNAKWLADVHQRAVADKEEVEKHCRVRLLEIGADCDHAQRKPRTVRLLCALEVPERFSHFLFQPGSERDLKFDSLLRLGPWTLGEAEPFILLVSVSRFYVLQDWQLSGGLEPMYRLRKPLVDVALHKYANYSARPGYIAITGQ